MRPAPSRLFSSLFTRKSKAIFSRSSQQPGGAGKKKKKNQEQDDTKSPLRRREGTENRGHLITQRNTKRRRRGPGSRERRLADVSDELAAQTVPWNSVSPRPARRSPGARRRFCGDVRHGWDKSPSDHPVNTCQLLDDFQAPSRAAAPTVSATQSRPTPRGSAQPSGYCVELIIRNYTPCHYVCVLRGE